MMRIASGSVCHPARQPTMRPVRFGYEGASEYSLHLHAHDHDEEAHGHQHVGVPSRPGDRFTHPFKRVLVNFVGWFYELFASFFRDLLGRPADLQPCDHDH